MNHTSHLSRVLTLCLVGCLYQTGRADDWLTWRSTYTHDPQTGMRVDQYASPVQPPSPDQGNLVRSGYRHYRSTIQGSTTADNLHIVHEWGRPVMPYEHWRFPFRPYGMPYQQWGPPVPNVWSNFNQNNQFGPWPAPPAGQVPVGQAPIGQMPGGQMPVGPIGPGLPVGPGAYPNPAGNPYPGMYPYPGGYPGSQAWPLVPPYQPAPWFDGLYPTAP